MIWFEVWTVQINQCIWEKRREDLNMLSIFSNSDLIRAYSLIGKKHFQLIFNFPNTNLMCSTAFLTTFHAWRNASLPESNLLVHYRHLSTSSCLVILWKIQWQKFVTVPTTLKMSCKCKSTGKSVSAWICRRLSKVWTWKASFGRGASEQVRAINLKKMTRLSGGCQKQDKKKACK